MNSIPSIHILLASYQGAAFIQEQLDSFAAQTHTRWTLTVSDDGSTDGTQNIVERFAQKVQQPVRLIEGPGQGGSANFLHLLHQEINIQDGDLLAFSDQDDVWLPHKLARAAAYFKNLKSQTDCTNYPHLYCTKTELVNEGLEHIGWGKVPQKRLSFANALLENVAAGNTMVFNQKLRELLKRIPPEHCMWHDWSAYLLATGCGGTAFFDTQHSLLYRQHQDNVFGSHSSWKASIARVNEFLKGTYREWNDANLGALSDIVDALSKESIELLISFEQMRNHSNPLVRLHKGLSSGIYRQGPSSQIAILFGLIRKLV